MTIGTPTQIIPGSTNNFNSGSASATVTTVAAPPGSFVVMTPGVHSGSGFILTFSDSAGNNWGILTSTSTVASFNNATLCYSRVTKNMPVGTNFTATTSTGAQWNFAQGYATANAIGDVLVAISASNTGSTSITSFSLHTSSLGWVPTITFGNMVTMGGDTLTESANFTNLFGAGAAQNDMLGYSIRTSSTDTIYAPTLSPADQATAVILTVAGNLMIQPPLDDNTIVRAHYATEIVGY